MEPTDLPEDNRRDLSISMARANLYGLLLVLPSGALLALPYFILWGAAAFGNAWQVVSDNLLPALGFFAIGIVAHEGIHGLSWMVFGNKPRRAIRYGFKLKTLTPYAHCTEPMDAHVYRLGAAMPGLLLGVGPWLASLATGHSPTFLFGLLFTLAALGDVMILWLLQDVPPTAQVIDHPTRAGCYVIEPEL